MTATEVFDADELRELLGSLPVDPLRLLNATLDLVGETNLTELMDVQLAADVVRLRRRMDRADAIFAEWTLASHQRVVCTVDGYRSTAAWLGWKTGMHRGQVRRVINTGEITELLPETGALWRAGKISTAAVDAITTARVPGHDDKLAAIEAEFLDLARRGDHASLRRATAYFADHARADGTPPPEPDGLRLSKVLDGRSNITGELSGLAAETITTALNAFMDPPSEGDGRTDAQRRADALVRICEIALEHGACGVRAGANVTVVVDWPTLTNGEPGRMDGQYTGPIPRSEIERLLCDCKVARVVMGPDSIPLDVGRSTRVWSPALRNAIVARDTHCRWPGCEIPAPWSEIHHHQHWEHGGETSTANGYLLCSHHHHHFLHRNPAWTTTFEDQTLHVYRPDRRELHPNPWHN
jgi:Domain of unknown function DUF222.